MEMLYGCPFEKITFLSRIDTNFGFERDWDSLWRTFINGTFIALQLKVSDYKKFKFHARGQKGYEIWTFLWPNTFVRSAMNVRPTKFFHSLPNPEFAWILDKKAIFLKGHPYSIFSLFIITFKGQVKIFKFLGKNTYTYHHDILWGYLQKSKHFFGLYTTHSFTNSNLVLDLVLEDLFRFLGWNDTGLGTDFLRIKGESQTLDLDLYQGNLLRDIDNKTVRKKGICFSFVLFSATHSL